MYDCMIMYVWLCMYICIYVCMYVRTYVCMYVCMIVWLYDYVWLCMYIHKINEHHKWSLHVGQLLEYNPFFLLLKLPQIKNRIGASLFLVGHNWILNCGNWESIGEQDGETMGGFPFFPPFCCIGQPLQRTATTPFHGRFWLCCWPDFA